MTGKYDESDDALLAALANGYHDPEEPCTGA